LRFIHASDPFSALPISSASASARPAKAQLRQGPTSCGASKPGLRAKPAVYTIPHVKVCWYLLHHTLCPRPNIAPLSHSKTSLLQSSLFSTSSVPSQLNSTTPHHSPSYINSLPFHHPSTKTRSGWTHPLPPTYAQALAIRLRRDESRG
jgi:hypothetical protein